MNPESFKKITNVFKKSLKKKSGNFINPIRDWTIGLLSAVAVFVGGVLFTGYDFYVQLVSVKIPEVSTQPLVYKENEVRHYAEVYNNKTREFNALKDNRPIIVPEEEVTSEGNEEIGPEDENTETLAEEGVAE